MEEIFNSSVTQDGDLGPLLPHEIVMIRHFRKANDSDQHSIAEYAAECAAGWPAAADAGTFRPDPPDGLIHLHDLSFDFDEYFERGLDQMSEGEREEFQARIYGMFCRDVIRSGGDMRRVSFWAANYVAERLYQALGGVPWEDIMGLPWDEPTPFLTPKGQRALSIYAGIENALMDNPDSNVTDLIVAEGKKHHVSYPTARDDYYKYKQIIAKKMNMPPNFLNDASQK